MPRKSKKIPSFYDWMMHFYLKDPDRYALAYNMKALSTKHHELKQIDSLTDLMIAAETVLTDPDAIKAATGGLWCEYCAMTGHEMT
jgi:hypothetical protein